MVHRCWKSPREIHGTRLSEVLGNLGFGRVLQLFISRQRSLRLMMVAGGGQRAEGRASPSLTERNRSQMTRYSVER